MTDESGREIMGMVTLHDIMSVDVVTVSPDATLREVAELLADRHISGVPVVAAGEVVGVVSAMDLLEFDASSRAVPMRRDDMEEWGEWLEPQSWSDGSEAPSTYFSGLWEDAGADVSTRLAETESPEWNVLEEHSVRELMTRSLCMLPADTDVREAAQFMLRAGIHRILVIRDGCLVGVVSTMDVVKAVAQHGLGG